MVPVMVRENNKVKCIFWDEKDGIFVLDLVSVKVEKQTGYISDTALRKRSNIQKRFVAPNPLYCVNSRSTKSAYFLPESMVGSNSMLLQITFASHKFFALSTQSNYSCYLKLAFFTDKLEGSGLMFAMSRAGRYLLKPTGV
jgi:hypothetical protein